MEHNQLSGREFGKWVLTLQFSTMPRIFPLDPPVDRLSLSYTYDESRNSSIKCSDEDFTKYEVKPEVHYGSSSIYEIQSRKSSALQVRRRAVAILGFTAKRRHLMSDT